jgi:TorA maturation chaperone TorD
MPLSESMTENAVDLARECLYRFLAAALGDPQSVSGGLLFDPACQRQARAAADLLRTEALAQSAPLGFGELPPERLTLGPLLETLPPRRDELTAEYDRIFGLVVSRECPPYETEYHPSTEPFFRSQQLADIAGFYRAFGIEPTADLPERPDHISLELEFLSLVLLKQRLAALDGPGADERVAVCTEAGRTFLRDHLIWWISAFATGLRRKGAGGFYAAVSEVLAAFVAAERIRFHLPAPRLPVQATLIERPEEQAGCTGCEVATG